MPAIATGTRLLNARPQHLTAPPSKVTQKPNAYEEVPVKRLVAPESPTTSSGLVVGALAPLPTAPRPQHFTLPPFIRAQLVSPSTAMARTPLARPTTMAGGLNGGLSLEVTEPLPC